MTFWDDLTEDLKDPTFLRAYVLESRRLQRRMAVSHWKTLYDTEDGEPFGTVCHCERDFDHEPNGEPSEVNWDVDGADEGL